MGPRGMIPLSPIKKPLRYGGIMARTQPAAVSPELWRQIRAWGILRGLNAGETMELALREFLARHSDDPQPQTAEPSTLVGAVQ